MGERGIDVKLSSEAKKFIPFAIECKNQETFKNLYKAYGQAHYNSKEKLEPIKTVIGTELLGTKRVRTQKKRRRSQRV